MALRPRTAQRHRGEPHAAAALSGLLSLPRSAPPSARAVSAFASDLRAIVVGALRVGDLVVIVLAGILSFWSRHDTVELPASYWWLVMLICLIAANTLQIGGLYAPSGLRPRLPHLARLAVAWTAAVLATISVISFTKTADEVSRIWMLLWATSSFVGLIGLRVALWACLARWRERGILVSNVAVVCEGVPGELLARCVEDAAKGDVRVLGVFRPRATRVAGGPGLDDLVQLTRTARVDEIAVVMSCADAPDLEAALRTLRCVPADVKLCLSLPPIEPFGASSIPMPTLVLCQRPLAGWRMAIKRSMDVAITAGLLGFFAPLMLLVTLLIKLDSPGPAIFRQRRFGFNKQSIIVYKFRTMYCEAADPTVPQARRNDPRVTRLGRFLRRSSLDELPQLFNVLAGDMSLVGPRPHAIVHDEKYAGLVDGYLARQRVKPGITGWAQVNGFRGETDTIDKMKGRIEHDLYYIEHWSPLFDLRILLLTIAAAFNQRNSY